MLLVKLLSGFSLCPVFKGKLKIFDTGTFEETENYTNIRVFGFKKMPTNLAIGFEEFFHSPKPV
jgi:hypothetical protein